MAASGGELTTPDLGAGTPDTAQNAAFSPFSQSGRKAYCIGSFQLEYSSVTGCPSSAEYYLDSSDYWDKFH